MMKDIVENSHVLTFLNIFLKYVGRFIYCHEPSDLIKLYAEEYIVNVYGYNLINMGIYSVTKLIQHFMHLNDLLQDALFPILSNIALEAIVLLGPIWIKAKYRVNIASFVRLPSPVLASLNDRDAARIERH